MKIQKLSNQERQSFQSKKTLKSGDFLQSQQWLKFQESVGRRTFYLENEGFLASIVEHKLPIVGKYLYVPKGLIIKHGTWSMKHGENSLLSESSSKRDMAVGIEELIKLAEKEKAGWIRIEPENEKLLETIRNIVETDVNKLQIIRAPHDMQPKEIFVLDITKSQEQLLAEMKPKTRYNIKLAEKKGVKIHVTCNMEHGTINKIQNSINKNQEIQNTQLEVFLRLTKEMAQRHGITAHPENYYRKMIEILPSEMLRIYVAQYEGKIIAANLVLFYGKTVTYLHGASGNEHRNVMAPFLLQWQAILDAKELGFEKYDFGGISTNYEKNTNVRTTNKNSSWSGITDFKLGFSPNTQPVEFPGSYDIIVNPRKYGVYRGLQRAKGLLLKVHR